MFKRINKRLARKLFASGKSFYIIAHKMRPGGPFHMGMTIHAANALKENWSFDQYINNFMYYNCSWETGYYPAFYLES